MCVFKMAVLQVDEQQSCETKHIGIKKLKLVSFLNFGK